ncbi:HSP20-like chaperone [Fomitiporia mediterranea MF3/22]|uniref:HSP20-like chaperone n=1 Tax=Fomitiporia mediterranea (strain MF3/22) TaxID=694068 RepID=UPI0004408BC6|nr:HSP20-like chaperone [Fomitiporia mediterranea MF3/22]EJC98114.1 HSP20-like chaperone [Fomitiporia mediterranea MF3/22]
MFNDPFFSAFPTSTSLNTPAVDVSEEPNAFVVEAELPGVKKENLELRDNLLTQPLQQTDDARAVTQQQNESTQLSTERTFSSASQFSRTIWLPRRVDGSGVFAKLEDGILRVRVPKAEDQESVKVNIE